MLCSNPIIFKEAKGGGIQRYKVMTLEKLVERKNEILANSKKSNLQRKKTIALGKIF